MSVAKKQTEWRHFRRMENIFDQDGREPMMRRIESTCRKLDETARTGAGPERERARLALTAYGRTLELIEELDKSREAMAVQA
jgi:hypothetical protein